MTVFYKQLEQMMEYTGRDIIPREIYLREYGGGTPINLVCVGLQYDGQGSFIQDKVPHEEDSQVFNRSNLPLISAICPSSILDCGRALSDKATWGFLLTCALEARVQRSGFLQKKEISKWQTLMDTVHRAPDRLCVSAEGNHLFFVGEKSARETAYQVEKLLQEGQSTEMEIIDLLS